MHWRWLISPPPDGLRHVHEQICQVLELSRQLLERAAATLTEPAPEQPDPIAATIDSQASELIREIYRRLVVHGAIHGSSADVPTMLAQAGSREHADAIREEARRLVETAAAVARTGHPVAAAELRRHTEDAITTLGTTRDAYTRWPHRGTVKALERPVAERWDDVLGATTEGVPGPELLIVIRYVEGVRRVRWHAQRLPP